ncbi:MAG TPA: hypothetical protein VMQ93_16205 [Novosphingobium sp.]|nr:hypothetical protein [Novosphingobium sp.]
MKILFAVIGVVLALAGFAMLIENLGSIRDSMSDPALVPDMGLRIVVAVSAGASLVAGSVFIATAALLHRRA